MRAKIAFITTLTLTVMTALPLTATAPYTAIIIDSGSPYFVPKSATVFTGAPIKWENPTPTEHTVTHTGCLEEGGICAFDSGIVMPNGSYVVPGLPPGQYPYICRVHPIMRGTIIVTDPTRLPSQL